MNLQALLDVGLSPDQETLTARVVAAAGELGFGLVSGVLMQGRFGSPNALVRSFGNPPEAYLESSKSLDDSLRDPLLASLLARPGHVVYGQDLYVRAGAADLWDCQAEFGYRCGLSVSLHEPTHGEAFLFGVDGTGGVPTNPGELLRLQSALHLLAMHAQAALKRLANGVVEAPQLSPLERITLQRAAATYSERGSLGIIDTGSAHALQCAARKLGVTSAPAAVLRAIEGGLIQR